MILRDILGVKTENEKMNKQKTCLIAALLIIMFHVPIYARDTKNKEPGEWKLARKTDMVSLSYRWISNDTLRTREMRAQFEIDAGISNILAQFSSPGNYYEWAVGVSECEIQKINENSWITYTLMDYPWPFKKKDLVTRYLVECSGKETVVFIHAEPDFFVEKEGIERIQNYQGEWRFYSDENGGTSVDYRVVSYTKPVFPRFVQDPVIQKLFIDSFCDLKKLAEAK